MTPAQVLQLQRSIGNQAVAGLISQSRERQSTRASVRANASMPKAHASGVIQRVYRDPDDDSKTLSKTEVEKYIDDAGLDEDGKEYVLQFHKHKREYKIGKYITTAQSLYGTTKPHTLDTYGSLARINSSKLRWPRRAQRDLKNTRNTAIQKFKNKKDPTDVFYLGSQSMGMGNSQLELKDEPDKTTAGGNRKRSHSEALLVGAQQVGTIVDQNKKRIKLAHYEPVYVTSTNEFCTGKAGQQNCHEHLAPKLTNNKTLPAFIANPYSGSDDADMFSFMVSAHDKLKNKKAPKKQKKVAPPPAYMSEDESEDDSKVPLYWIDTEALEGVDLKSASEIEVKQIFRDDSFS